MPVEDGKGIEDGRLKALLDSLERAEHLAILHGAPAAIIECLQRLTHLLAAAVLRSEPTIKMAADVREAREKLSYLLAEDVAKYN